MKELMKTANEKQNEIQDDEDQNEISDSKESEIESDGTKIAEEKIVKKSGNGEKIKVVKTETKPNGETTNTEVKDIDADGNEKTDDSVVKSQEGEVQLAALPLEETKGTSRSIFAAVVIVGVIMIAVNCVTYRKMNVYETRPLLVVGDYGDFEDEC